MRAVCTYLRSQEKRESSDSRVRWYRHNSIAGKKAWGPWVIDKSSLRVQERKICFRWEVGVSEGFLRLFAFNQGGILKRETGGTPSETATPAIQQGSRKIVVVQRSYSGIIFVNGATTSGREDSLFLVLAQRLISVRCCLKPKTNELYVFPHKT